MATPYILTRLTVVSKNQPREGCDITEGSEITQSHDQHGCINKAGSAGWARWAMAHPIISTINWP